MINKNSRCLAPNDIANVADVVQLCMFAKEATNMDDEFSKGMREAFDYVIKCCNEHVKTEDSHD